MRTSFLTIALVAAGSSAAQAQWLNKTDDDPFGGDKSSLAMTISGGYGFGFSCRGTEQFQIVYVTTEDAREGTDALNLLNPILKMKIDDLEPVDLPAEIDKAGDKLRLSTSDDKVLQVVKTMALAKRRIAVAVELGSKRFHIQSFGVNGSRDAVGSAIKACKLDTIPAG